MVALWPDVPPPPVVSSVPVVRAKTGETAHGCPEVLQLQLLSLYSEDSVVQSARGCSVLPLHICFIDNYVNWSSASLRLHRPVFFSLLILFILIQVFSPLTGSFARLLLN